jgi:rare lipoprotein A
MKSIPTILPTATCCICTWIGYPPKEKPPEKPVLTQQSTPPTAAATTLPQTEKKEPIVIFKKPDIIIKTPPTPKKEVAKNKKPPTKGKVLQTGIASWYGSENPKTCKGKHTSKTKPTAAHKTLPIGSKVKITRIKTGKSVIVEIEDRGPYCKSRIIDLNKVAAQELGIINDGTAKVQLERID